WRKVVEMSGGSPAAQRNLALSLFLAKDHQAAKVLVDRFLKQEPQSSQWNYLAGEIFLAREQAREALPFLQRAVKNEPDFLPAQASLARAYMALERPADAIPHLERAIANDSDGSLHYQLGRAYQRTGNLERARTALQKYQEIQRKNREETARLEQEAEIRAPE
ncbi:MAG TPA: tetratricopeptide repeat protein, partial [Acidobacteriota bacterium]|nr:tetratricopeptide repeat protein [Acidobacteriota bacterium]